MANASLNGSVGRTLILAIVLFGVAVAIRLAVFHEVHDDPLYQHPTLDERGNHEFALAILHDRVPEASYYKAPLYTYFLAGVYAVFGEDSNRARLVQTILVSLTPMLAGLTARHLFGWIVGLIAGLWTAVFWTFVFFSAELLDTALACLFYMLLAYLLVAWDDRSRWKWLCCGAVLGLGAITRPNILAYAPLLALIVFVHPWRRGRQTHRAASDETKGMSSARGGTFGRGVLAAGLLTVGCCAAVLPVTLRNRIVGGEWVLLGAYGGLNVHVANNPHSDSKDGPLLVDESVFLEESTLDTNEPWARCCLNFANAYRYTEAKLGREPTRGEFSALLAREGFAYLREHPGWFARHALRRLCWLFNAYEYPSNKDLYHFLRFSEVLTALSYFHYGIVAPLGLVGIGLALTRKPRGTGVIYLAAMVASLALPAILFIVNTRFRLPMVHLLVLFAAYAVVEILRLAANRTNPRRLGVALLALALLAPLSNLDLFGYREAHQPYLRFAYAVACLLSEDQARFDRALEHFEHDLRARLAEYERDGRRSNTTLLLDHCHPMRLLLPYYLERGRDGEAIWAGRQMLTSGESDPEWLGRLVDLFVSVNRCDLADEAVGRLEAESTGTRPVLVAEKLLHFGQACRNRHALERARRLYKRLTESAPTNALFAERTRTLGELLGGGTTRTSAKPTASAPTE